MYENAKVKRGTMKKQKIIIYYEMFVPWIFEDYDQSDTLEAWASGDDIKDYAIGIAGLIPIQHMKNWDDIKHHFDVEPCDQNGFTKWSDYYEDDGYIHGPEVIPDTLEIEWDYTPWEEL